MHLDLMYGYNKGNLLYQGGAKMYYIGIDA